ncbi:Plancitoxin-1 [Trichinella nativa]|uniref:Plancitoxin-1 n=1 Tax=Trichinella nativa TaxID=6335 RepID=A0A0V1L1D9_9BILA|nr:Plancitoxin-1 [Trichinella nativa]
MLVNAERAVMHIRWIFVLWFSFPRYSEATSKCYNLNGDMKLKTSIKVWITRNKTLKSDCRILGRNIQLVTSPIAVNGHAGEPGSKFYAINKPYYANLKFSVLHESKFHYCFNKIDFVSLTPVECGKSFFILLFVKNLLRKEFMHFTLILCRAIMYKAPTQNRGKALIAGAAGAWQDTVAVTGENGHSFAKALEHVIAADATNKFIAYNNIPPEVPKVNTKSNSKGLLMMNPQDADEASWIVHTVPGFPKALRGYVFPPAEIQKGHLFICLTIKESEIDAIAMALRIATPLIYHNDIPDAEIDSRPNLKKLVNAASRLTPPLTVTRQISTTGVAGLKVTIYSKGEKSKYEIYRRVLVKKLKTSIKVWTTRDKTLKSDCRILSRYIKLVTSPITISGHASSLESDVSHWLISDPGNKFCAVDKPYHKSQTKEPAIAVCIDDATIFGHFNLIGQNVENCA